MSPTEILSTLLERDDLSEKAASSLLENIMSGEITPVQAGAILTALRMKGESESEIIGFIKKMREKMLAISAPGAIDIVGTGGAAVDPFNISTAAAFVARGAGARVAKHGNRAASSKCGSFDVLEALGVKIDLSPERAQAVFEATGMVFMFAPLYHPAMKQVVVIRRELKVRTVFNILGPFTNPARTTKQLTGVPDLSTAKRMAEVSRGLGYQNNLIVTSEDGMDEFSTRAKTRVFEVRGRRIRKMIVDPQRLGFKRPSESSLKSGTKEENAEMIRAIFRGEKGPRRDVVVLNAGAALYAAGLAKTIKDGITLASQSIDSGKAEEALKNLVEETNKPIS